MIIEQLYFKKKTKKVGQYIYWKMNILDNNFRQQVGSLPSPSLFYNHESANDVNALDHFKRILENEHDNINTNKFLSMLLVIYRDI